MTIPENGYLAVYLSNSSDFAGCSHCTISEGDVYFDQLQITFTKGHLQEETGYYPFGLPIAAMGGSAMGMTPNRQKYQSNEYITEAGLDWMSFGARQYDPQLGRFLSVDPLADAGGQELLSPYQAMGDNPVSGTDPGGTMQGGDDPPPPPPSNDKTATDGGIHLFSPFAFLMNMPVYAMPGGNAMSGMAGFAEGGSGDPLVDWSKTGATTDYTQQWIAIFKQLGITVGNTTNLAAALVTNLTMNEGAAGDGDSGGGGGEGNGGKGDGGDDSKNKSSSQAGALTIGLTTGVATSMALRDAAPSFLSSLSSLASSVAKAVGEATTDAVGALAPAAIITAGLVLMPEKIGDNSEEIRSIHGDDNQTFNPKDYQYEIPGTNPFYRDKPSEWNSNPNPRAPKIFFWGLGIGGTAYGIHDLYNIYKKGNDQ